MIEVPIFHVNGEDPEAVVFVGELALDFRQTFGKDVVIDMFCYRRHGHNEGDEPAFTQPLMYEKIKNRISIRELYTEQLVMAGELTSQRGRDDRRDVRRQAAGGARGGPARGRRAAGRRTAASAAPGPAWRPITRSSRSRRASPTRRCGRSPRSVAQVPAGLHGQPQAGPAARGPRQDDGGRRGRSTGRSPRCWRSARCSAKTRRSA